MLAGGWLNAAAENPYNPIVARNIFGLFPIPVHNPANDVAVTPPPKITPNGIMNIFGRLQVLFKVAATPPGQPPKEVSYTMGEGERQDEITVQKIDEPAATITFDNHGTIQTLELAKGSAAGGAVPLVPGASGMIPRPFPTVAPAAGGATAPMGFGGRFGRSRAGPVTPNPNSSVVPRLPGFGGGGAAVVNNNASQVPSQNLSYEEKVLNMEAQRAKWLDEGNSAAVIIPPTPITKNVTGEEESGGPPVP
ncbi:MAG TPA: hypothetical protein VGI63_06900 [Verrucomicrobiae bacterium]